jgi:hypothetical protein
LSVPDGIISYQIPEDIVSWKDNEHLSDVSYDGVRENGYLINGLGRLVDGILGGDNYKIDIGYGKGTCANFAELLLKVPSAVSVSRICCYTRGYNLL